MSGPLEGLGDPRDPLADHHHLHEWIVGQGDQVADHGLLLGHEIVRVGDMADHPAPGRGAVLLDELLGPAHFVLALGDGGGADADVEGALAHPLGLAGQQEAGKEQRDHPGKHHHNLI